MVVTTQRVKNIYSGASVLDDAIINDIITVVDSLAVELALTTAYSDTMVDTIKAYLVAHLLSVGYEHGGVTRKRVGQSEEDYRTLPSTTEGLSASLFGQQAQALDFKGLLSALSTNSVRAQFRII